MLHLQHETFSAKRTCPWMPAILMLSALFAATLRAQVRSATEQPGPPLPEGPGRDVTHKVCGATCHGTDVIVGKGRTRDQWTAVVNAMVARGAKASDAELVQITEYLSSRLGPNRIVTGISTPATDPVAARPERPGADPVRSEPAQPIPMSSMMRAPNVASPST